MAPAQAPMAGLRVIDFTTMIAGPHCTRLLADCGASVIKVESGTGDHIRHVAPFSGTTGMYFGQLNCGKQSVVLDLKTDAGKAQAAALIREADVVVENFRPGVMQRLGLDYASVSVDNPSLIYCSISGFGQEGPRALAPAYAPVMQAASGYELAHMTYQGNDRPDRCGIFTADVLAAAYAFGAIQTALLGRARFGNGQFIDVALLDSMLNLLIYECQVAQSDQHKPRMLYTPTRACDGFVIIEPVSQKNFEEMAVAMDRADWITDPRFVDDAQRRTHWSELVAQMEAWTSTREARECERLLGEAGVPCSRYRSVGEAMRDPQSEARGLMATIATSEGEFLVPNAPFKFADGSVHVKPHVPALGEHNDELSGS